MIEAGARLIEADRTIACTVPNVDDLEISKAELVFKQERRLLGDNENVQRAEKLQVVSVHQQLRGRDQSPGQCLEDQAGLVGKTKLDQFQVGVEGFPGEDSYFPRDPLVGRANDDLSASSLLR